MLPPMPNDFVWSLVTPRRKVSTNLIGCCPLGSHYPQQYPRRSASILRWMLRLTKLLSMQFHSPLYLKQPLTTSVEQKKAPKNGRKKPFDEQPTLKGNTWKTRHNNLTPFKCYNCFLKLSNWMIYVITFNLKSFNWWQFHLKAAHFEFDSSAPISGRHRQAWKKRKRIRAATCATHRERNDARWWRPVRNSERVPFFYLKGMALQFQDLGLKYANLAKYDLLKFSYVTATESRRLNLNFDCVKHSVFKK